ncbi:MAG TPA: ABC transporter ATP-binding protein [Planctomycetia bacterium]|nr:ABC transporter ATP-binding protein [Planctomycetia bacterium]
MARIALENLSLTFKLRAAGRVSLKDLFVRRKHVAASNPLTEVRALRDVTLSVGEGERLGIIGHNGAGKSTLLRTIAGIYPPTSGTRSVEGKIGSLFDLALGFEPEASGWENIAFRSYLQGETPRSIKRKIAPIAEFSELGSFLDLPLRFYSAGMKVRLAFSIATAIEPEILLLDEVLGAGDLSFLEKANRRMKELMAKAKLMVVVSHDLKSIETLCDRVLWMEQGQVRMIGRPKETIATYTDYVHKLAAPKVGAAA